MKTWNRTLPVLLALVLLPATVHATQVTVKTNDLPFETAKQILLGQDRNLSGVADDALKQILQNKVTLSFDDGLLPETVRTKLKADRQMATVTETLQEGKNWAQMGEAIGIATRGALAAISEETQKFANTTPGVFLMAMVAWKVMGADFLHTIKGYLIGVPLLIFWCWIFATWLRRVYWPHRATRWVEAKDSQPAHKVVEEVSPLSVQWNKDWAEACAKSGEPEKMGQSEMVWFAAFKTAGFVAGIFLIVWGVI